MIAVYQPWAAAMLVKLVRRSSESSMPTQPFSSRWVIFYCCFVAWWLVKHNCSTGFLLPVWLRHIEEKMGTCVVMLNSILCVDVLVKTFIYYYTIVVRHLWWCYIVVLKLNMNCTEWWNECPKWSHFCSCFLNKKCIGVTVSVYVVWRKAFFFNLC